MIKIPFSTFQYEITGTATNAVASTTILQMATATFQTWRIQTGDTIYNITDGQTATINSIDSQTQLTCTALSGAASWNNGDQFRIWVSEPNRFSINIIDTLDFPMYAEVLIANRNNTSQTAYSKYQRVRIIENNSGGNLVLFSGKAETIDPYWDANYGQVLKIQARDNLAELAKRIVRTNYDSSTGYIRRSQLIRRIIDDHVFQASNIDTTQPEFVASTATLAAADLASKYTGAGKNALRAIIEIAQEDPWDATSPTGFGFDFYLDTDFGASAIPSPDFNYFRRDNNPANPSADGLTVLYLGTVGDQTMQMLHDFQFTTEDRELITRAKVRYQTDAGASNEIDTILINHTAPAPAAFTVGNELRWGANRATVEYIGDTYTIISNDDSATGTWLNTISGLVITEFTQAGAATGNSATVNARTASTPGSLREAIEQEIEIVSREYEKETITRARNWAAQVLYHSGNDITRGEFSIITWPTYEIVGVDSAVRAGHSIRVNNSLVSINSDMVVTKIDYQENPNTRIARISVMGPTRGRTVIRGIIEQIRDVAEGATWETPAAGGGVALTAQLVNLNFTFTTATWNTFSWAGGTATFSDGSTQTINATGSPYTIPDANIRYIYIIRNNATLQITDSFSTVVGIDNILIAIAKRAANSNEDAVQIVSVNGGSSVLSANTILANELSAISANMGLLTAGEIRVGSGDPNAGPSTFTGHRIYLSGGIGVIEGQNAGILRWQATTTGKIQVFGGADADASLEFFDGGTLRGTIWGDDGGVLTGMIIKGFSTNPLYLGGGASARQILPYDASNETIGSSARPWSFGYYANLRLQNVAGGDFSPSVDNLASIGSLFYFLEVRATNGYFDTLNRRTASDGGNIGSATAGYTNAYIDNLFPAAAASLTLQATMLPVSSSVDLGDNSATGFFGSIFVGQRFNRITGSTGDMDFRVMNTAGNNDVLAMYIQDGDAPDINIGVLATLTILSGTQLNLGTHIAIGAETVTGYITIKDAGGTDRKIAVVS